MRPEQVDHAQRDAPVSTRVFHGLGQQEAAQQQQDQRRTVGLADLCRRQHTPQWQNRQRQQPDRR